MDLQAMSTAERVRSAHEAAVFGLYGYSPVPGHLYAPFRVVHTHVTEQPNEFLQCPVGTALHLSESVTCWRVTGYVLPNGRHYELTST